MLDYSILLTGIPVTSERGSLGWCTVAYLHLLGRHILFDTGSYGDRSLLLKKLEKLDLCPESIDTIVVSHLHFDHFVNAEIFCNATILVHKKEIEYVLSGDYIRVGDPYVPIGVVRYLENRLTPIEDGESILPGLEVMLMAGHTPGTIGLYFKPEKILFTSDSVKNAWEFVRNEPPPAFYSKDAAFPFRLQRPNSILGFLQCNNPLICLSKSRRGHPYYLLMFFSPAFSINIRLTTCRSIIILHFLAA
jgi:glyoxylase-like metal-dependent hydrolase (beta-lactamase superfamily II)